MHFAVARTLISPGPIWRTTDGEQEEEEGVSAPSLDFGMGKARFPFGKSPRPAHLPSSNLFSCGSPACSSHSA